ncbi:MAG: hypothetical protein ACREOI_04915 [bacterium]
MIRIAMVRAYEGRFLRALTLKSMGMEINTEIIYKAQLLNARIAEIPAHLHWEAQPANGVQRQSHLKIARHIGKCLFTGFIFRPAAFFLTPGVAALLASFFTLGWALFG